MEVELDVDSPKESLRQICRWATARASALQPASSSHARSCASVRTSSSASGCSLALLHLLPLTECSDWAAFCRETWNCQDDFLFKV